MGKKQIKVTDSELRSVIQECIERTLKETFGDSNYFGTYADFEKYFEETEGTMEYLIIYPNIMNFFEKS